MFGQLKILVYLTVAVLASGYLFLSWVRPERLSPIARRLPPMMVAILLAGYLVPNFYYLYALLFVLPVALSRTRVDACVIVVVALLGVPAVAQYVVVGGVYLTSIDTWRVLALGLLLAMLVRPAPAGSLRGSRFDLPFLILVTLAILSQLRGQNLTSMIRIVEYEGLGLAALYYSVSRSIRKPEDVNRLLLAIAFGGFVLSAMSIYEAVKSWPIYLGIDYRLGRPEGLSQNFKMRGGLMRTAASFAESTSFSVFLAMAVLAATASRDAFRSRSRYMLVIGVLMLGLLLAQSRGGWIAVAIGVLAYDLYLRNYSRLGMKIAIGALGVMLLVFAAQGSVRLSEMLGLSGNSAGTADYRVQLFKRGMDEIRKHPFVGNDLAEVSLHLADLTQGEHIIDFVNGYILYGVTLGIPGMIALFILFVSLAVFMFVRRGPARRGEPPDRTGAMVFATACFYVVTAATSGFGGRPVAILIVVIAIGSVHHLLGRRPVARVAPPGRAPAGSGMPAPAQPA